MKKKIIFSIFALAVSAGILQVGSVFASNGGGTDEITSSQALAVAAPQIFPPIDFFKRYDKANHVANGVALRNRTSGTIALRGVPAGSTVVKAFLYWNFLDAVATGPAFSPALFNGNRVNGAKAAEGPANYWFGVTTSHSYRADVTRFMSTTNPNQDYEVAPVFNTLMKTHGINPWPDYVSQPKVTEGATLIVIYTNANLTTNAKVFIYDAFNNMAFIPDPNPSGFNGATFTLNHPALTGPGLFTVCGADGQRCKTGHDNIYSGETGFFNGVQISGPPVCGSDWDGSAGLPLPQLWDVHTHLLSAASAVPPAVEFTGLTSTVITYIVGTTGFSDQVIPVVFVLQRGFETVAP